MLYLLPWLSIKEVQRIHRRWSRHHVHNPIIKNKKDYIQMIVDWESAKFMKADKQLSAYETMEMFYPSLRKVITPIMQELHLL
ncbi:MAG: hypothetical protein LBD11_02395 [Candidatus Peribacteria bacterium]|nr:hypothetical protein [Candidatus Peribacteria bacterium]